MNTTIRGRGRRRGAAAEGMATIRDVAQASKVSIATVSRAFNGSALVRGDTRRKVLAMASRLGYWPNGIARSLITNRTHALGVLLPDLFGEFFSEVVHGMDLAGRERGYHLLISRTSSSADDLIDAARTMRGRVDGLIVMAPGFDPTPAVRHGGRAVPAVLINPQRTPPGCDSVSIANAKGAAAAVSHLIGLGHRSIGFLSGPESNVDARQRRDGWHAALSAAGIEPTSDLEYGGDFTEHSGYDVVGKMLRSSRRPTALFAGNDYMAVGALGALHDAGVRVPEDIAVVGFDDIALARYLNPPLTTVRVEMLGLGRRAVEILLERADRAPGAVERHEVLATTLVVRSSCGAGPADASGHRHPGNGHGALPTSRR